MTEGIIMKEVDDSFAVRRREGREGMIRMDKCASAFDNQSHRIPIPPHGIVFPRLNGWVGGWVKRWGEGEDGFVSFG